MLRKLANAQRDDIIYCWAQTHCCVSHELFRRVERQQGCLAVCEDMYMKEIIAFDNCSRSDAMTDVVYD